MKVQIRIGDLSPEQERKEDIYYTAVKILRAAGIDCEYCKCFCSKPTDEPGYISLRSTP